MTIVASQSTLTRKDYPEFEQTVGNSFASSYPDAIKNDEAHLARLANVSQGLFKIYENVVADAADGAPMTPRDSAVISTTVANMTSSVGVESDVQPMVSLESRYDQHMCFIVTQESLGETIKKTVKAFLEAFMRLVDKIVTWVKKMYAAAQDNSRPLLRVMNTIQRLNNAAIMTVTYTPSMEGILVDGQIPAKWMGKVIDTLRIAGTMMEDQAKMAGFANDVLFAVEKANFNTPEAAVGEVEKVCQRRPKLTLGSNKTRVEQVDGKVIEWSEPLCANSLAIAMNPQGDEPIDAVNYGIGLIHLSVAAEFGVKTKYNEDDVNGDSLVTLDIGDFNRNQKQLVNELNTAGHTFKRMNDAIEKLQASLNNVTERYRKLEQDPDTTSEAIEKLLTYTGVARSVASAAVACSRYNFDIYSTVVGSATAVFNAISKKAGGR